MNQSRHLFVVLNPMAGLVDPKRTAGRIRSWCDQHGWTCEIYETSEDENLSVVVKAALQRGCAVVAAAGGDGTVSGVAAGLVFSDTPLAILPLGTGNLLARDLGVPSDLNRALGLIDGDGTPLLLDTMEVNGRYCVLNAGVGLSSLIIQNTGREEKRRFGMLAYFKTATWALFGLQPHRFKLTVDGKGFKISASEIYIANGGLLGLQLPFEDVHVYPDDGRVDVFVIKARTLIDYLELLYFIIRRKPRQTRKMFYIQGSKSIRIVSEATLPAQADGEVIGETPISIKVIPNAVRVLRLESHPARQG